MVYIDYFKGPAKDQLLLLCLLFWFSVSSSHFWSCCFCPIYPGSAVAILPNLIYTIEMWMLNFLLVIAYSEKNDIWFYLGEFWPIGQRVAILSLSLIFYRDNVTLLDIMVYYIMSCMCNILHFSMPFRTFYWKLWFIVTYLVLPCFKMEE